MKQGVVRQRGRNGTLPFIVLHRNQYSCPHAHARKAITKRFSHIPYNWILRARMTGWVGAALGIVLVTLIQSANQTTAEERRFPLYVQCISDDSRLTEVRRLELVKEIHPSKYSIYVLERDARPRNTWMTQKTTSTMLSNLNRKTAGRSIRGSWRLFQRAMWCMKPTWQIYMPRPSKMSK